MNIRHVVHGASIHGRRVNLIDEFPAQENSIILSVIMQFNVK